MATAQYVTLTTNFTGLGATLPYDKMLLDDSDVTVSAYQAYGLRRLRAAYTGPLVKVRRSSDSALLDITNATNDTYLDTAALLAFVGAGDGFVTTWYDQSGNARDMTQATTTKQPKIVESGVLVTAGSTGKAGLHFLGSDCYLKHTSPGLRTLIPASGASICQVHKGVSGLVPYGESDQAASGAGGHMLPFYFDPSLLVRPIFTNSSNVTQSPYPQFTVSAFGEFHADMLIKPTTGGSLYRDGVLKATSSFTPTLPTASASATLGGYESSTTTVLSDYTGIIGEHILFSGVLNGNGIQKVATSHINHFGL